MRGVEISRYRPREKLDLDRDTNLVELIMGFINQCFSVSPVFPVFQCFSVSVLQCCSVSVFQFQDIEESTLIH